MHLLNNTLHLFTFWHLLSMNVYFTYCCTLSTGQCPDRNVILRPDRCFNVTKYVLMLRNMLKRDKSYIRRELVNKANKFKRLKGVKLCRQVHDSIFKELIW